MVQVVVHLLHQRVQLREYPTVQLGFGTPVSGDLIGFKFINVRIVGKEGVHIPQSKEHPTERFINQFVGETSGFAGMGRGEQIPPQRVGAVGVKNRDRVNDVSQTFAHLSAAAVENESKANDVPVSNVVFQ